METPPAPEDQGGQAPLPPPSLSPGQPPAAEPAAPPAGAAPPPPSPPSATPPAPGAPPPPPHPSTLYGAAPPPPPPAPPGYYGGPGYAMPGATDGPAPGLRYAGFGIRVGAYIIDAIIILVVSLVVSPALGGITKDTQTIVLGTTVTTTSSVNGAWELFNFLLSVIYFVGFWSLNNGRTPGMMALRLRVLRAADGKPVTIGQSVIRYVGLLISFWVVFIGVIWVAFDPRRQGWHDKMAGTFVVQEVPQTAWGS